MINHEHPTKYKNKTFKYSLIMKNQKLLSVSLTALAILFFITSGFAQESQEHEKTQEEWEAEEAALAKATQNPLAAMYSLPLQNNTTYGIGEFNRPQNF